MPMPDSWLQIQVTILATSSLEIIPRDIDQLVKQAGVILLILHWVTLRCENMVVAEAIIIIQMIHGRRCRGLILDSTAILIHHPLQRTRLQLPIFILALDFMRGCTPILIFLFFFLEVFVER